jgi:hypothetical protein
MIENINEVEALLKMPEGTLKSALESSESVKIEMPKVIVRTPDEDEAFKENLRKAGAEITAKKQAELLGLNLNSDDKRDINKVFEAFKAKTLEGVNIEPNEKVKGLEADKAKLLENYTTLEGQFNEFKSNAKSKLNSVLIDTKIDSSITGDLILPKDDVKALFKSKYQVELDENGIEVVKKDGEILKNQTTLNPYTLKDIMGQFLPTYAKKPEGGSGAGDNSGAAKGTMDAFNKEMTEKGVNIGSSAYNQEMSKRIREKSLVV